MFWGSFTEVARCLLNCALSLQSTRSGSHLSPAVHPNGPGTFVTSVRGWQRGQVVTLCWAVAASGPLDEVGQASQLKKKALWGLEIPTLRLQPTPESGQRAWTPPPELNLRAVEQVAKPYAGREQPVGRIESALLFFVCE